jgi:hypothetical protein
VQVIVKWLSLIGTPSEAVPEDLILCLRGAAAAHDKNLTTSPKTLSPTFLRLASFFFTLDTLELDCVLVLVFPPFASGAVGIPSEPFLISTSIFQKRHFLAFVAIRISRGPTCHHHDPPPFSPQTDHRLFN